MIIYFDMDGVLADFMSVYKNYNDNMVHSTNESIDTTKFQQFVQDEGFIKLKPLNIGKELLDYYSNLSLHKDGFLKFGILSSTASAKVSTEFGREVVRQKKLWLINNFPNINFSETLFTVHKGRKKYFATPNSILLDDNMNNVEDFRLRGGISFFINDDISIKSAINKIDSAILYIKEHNDLH